MARGASHLHGGSINAKSLRKTVYVDTEVEVTLYPEDFDPKELAELLGMECPPGFNIEMLYYATRGDVWTHETREKIRDLLAAIAGRIG